MKSSQLDSATVERHMTASSLINGMPVRIIWTKCSTRTRIQGLRISEGIDSSKLDRVAQA
jgi:urocanate hydratase